VKGDPIGNFYVADPFNNRVRKIDAVSNIVTTIVGTGGTQISKGFFPATSATISYPQFLSLDTNGALYITEGNNVHTIRKMFFVSSPTGQPSRQPTGQPTKQPFAPPTAQPSRQPIGKPTAQPSSVPTSQPSRQPLGKPTAQPSSAPTSQPSRQPIGKPTAQPSSAPTSQPSRQPMAAPSVQPISRPSNQPTESPSSYPSYRPSSVPSTQPSSLPSRNPTSMPSSHPTLVPTGGSSARPTEQPSGQPSNKPSSQPFRRPSSVPTKSPSHQPTSRPSCFPSGLPSSQPSQQPISCPTSLPSSSPTFQPTILVPRGLKQAIAGFYDAEGNLNDKSGYGNHGKAHGGISFVADRFGSEKSAIRFDGKSGYIEVPKRITDQLELLNFTLSFWMYPNISQLVPGTCVFDKSPNLDDSWGWSFVYLYDNIFEFTYGSRYSGRRLAVMATNISSSSVLLDVSDNDWSHITLLKKLNTLLVYRDGYLINSTSIALSVSLQSSSAAMVIGTSKDILLGQTDSNMNLSYFSGSLDDIFIYDRAISLSEITQLREFASPTSLPSAQPSTKPSLQPSSSPTRRPSVQPTSFPSGIPSRRPSGFPSSQPTGSPSKVPSVQPTSRPSCFPSGLPSSQPSQQPISCPTSLPSSSPTFQPTILVPRGLKQAIAGFYDAEGNLNDKSGYGNHGKAHGGISFVADRFGSEKSAIRFDGKSGYIEVPKRITDQLELLNFTLSFWMYPNISQLVPGTCVFDKSPNLDDSWGWSFVYLYDNIFEFTYGSRYSGRRLAVMATNISSSSVLLDVSDNDWSHITLLKKLNTLLVYRDGYLINSTSIALSVSLQSSSAAMVIGTSKDILLGQTDSNMNLSYFSGSLDDIFIYDRAISLSEITQLREFASPTSLPSAQPSTKPSLQPSSSPTRRPSVQPTSFPSSIPSRRPSGFPSSQPTGSPSKVPSVQPTSSPSKCPTNRPTARPSGQPSDQPSAQPFGRPSSAPSSQPRGAPTMIPSVQPSSRPTKQPTSIPSSQPSSQPTKNRMHCTVSNNTFYSPIRDDCVKCPLHSFLNHTGDETCHCKGGYSQVGIGLTVNCMVCATGEVSLPGSSNCTQCFRGFFANSETNTCELCPFNFYSSSPGQSQCTQCPAGRATAILGSTSPDQCISPVPNFTLGFFALFLVVMIFCWYIVFGKFQRVSFERKLKIVTPNIEKCKQVLLSEEEFHYQHLIVVQNKKNQHARKFKFVYFAVLSFVLMVVSVFLGFVFFTYQVFFTSLILWRGLKADLNLSPILHLLAEGLKDITEFVSLPVNLFYFVALPFLYLFQALAKIDLNLSSVNVTCAGSQAPIELLINCFILGLLVIIIRSDYQLLFNILLSNLNQRFLLNNVEQRLDAGNFRFSRYFFLCLLVSALNALNPFQVGLRYCMGFVRIDTFAKKHGVAHEISESCNQVPGAPHFDSFLGYMSTIFAWWLILPALYCLAEVVVPKCKKIDPLKKQLSQEKRFRKPISKIFPADLFVDESVKKPSSGRNNIKNEEYDNDDDQNERDKYLHDIEEPEAIRLPEFPNRLSSKFPGVDEAFLAQVFQESCKERFELEKERKQRNDVKEYREANTASTSRKAIHKVTKRLPFILAFYYYCKQKYLLVVSLDLWVSNLFSSWITVLKENTLKAGQKEELILLKQVGIQPIRMTQIVSAKDISVKTPGVKQLFSLDSSEFIQGMHLYDLEQMRRQKKLDSLWERERLRNNHSLPSYYELCLIVRDELHDYVLEPFASLLALLGVGHFLTPTGRYYWKLVLNNYKIFLCVCLGIWTDEAVEAYGLEETSANLSVDGRASLYRNEEKTLSEKYEERKSDAKNHNSALSRPSILPSSPSRRKFSAQVFGVTIKGNARDDQGGTRKKEHSESEKENMREVLPAVISVLICSRVILFQIVPSLVLFATVSMTLASFPLFIFNDFLVETLPALIIYGPINREMAIERELKSFVTLNPDTKEVLSEPETIRVLSEDYSWRLSVRGIILFWNESRLLQFIQSSLTLFFSFLLLIYTRDLLVYLIVILGILFLFIITKSLVFLLYLGSSLDVKDSDFPLWLRGNHSKLKSSSTVVPEEDVDGEIVSGPFTPSAVATLSAVEQKQTEEIENEVNNNVDPYQSNGLGEVENEPKVMPTEVGSVIALPDETLNGNNGVHYHDSDTVARSCREENKVKGEGKDLSSLDFDNFDFSDVTPSLEEEEEGASPSLASELSSFSKHKANGRSSMRIDRSSEDNDRSFDRKARQNPTNNNNNNNFDSAVSKRTMVTNGLLTKGDPSFHSQVSDSEDSDSDGEEVDLDEFMNVYLQNGEMDLESGFLVLPLKK
jgi:hypothetical protein